MRKWASLLLLVACGTDNWKPDVERISAGGIPYSYVTDEFLGSAYAPMLVLCPEESFPISGGCFCGAVDGGISMSTPHFDPSGWDCRCTKSGIVRAIVVCVEAQ